jgi:hypothetical protein
VAIGALVAVLAVSEICLTHGARRRMTTSA